MWHVIVLWVSILLGGLVIVVDVSFASAALAWVLGGILALMLTAVVLSFARTNRRG
jgi:hypothetical protein